MSDFIKAETTTYVTHHGYEHITGKTNDGSSTLLELLQKRVAKFPNRAMLSAINKALEIENISFSDVNFCSLKLAQFLVNITNPGEIIGIASANRPEWAMAEYATYYVGCVNSPLYTTFKEEALSYILSVTEMRILIASPSFALTIVQKVMDFVKSDILKLEYIILMEDDQSVKDVCLEKGLKVVSMEDILFGSSSTSNDFYFDQNFTICAKATKYFKENAGEMKKMNDLNRELPKSESLASICFTSGTTGVPKGVNLTHRNFITQVESFELSIKDYDIFKLCKDTVYLSFLPLSHVFERVCFVNCIAACARICFFRGDKTKIGEDIKLAQPTFIAAVPKILQAFHQKIEDEVAKKRFHERFIFKSAVALKIFLQKFNIKSVGFIDRTIFKNIPLAFGGKIEDILCGGASIDPDLIKYLKAVMGANVFQGYGQTEGLGANALSSPSMNDAATVGVPFPSIKFKLVSIETGSKSSSLEKALMLKGHAIMSGYYKPKADILTKLLETGQFNFKIENLNENPFDEDGWLITGDVVIHKDGKIYIVGRTKDLVKLDNGEYISPESIENRLRETEFIKDVFISKIKNEDKFVALVSAPNENVTPMKIANYLKNSLSLLIKNKVIPRCVVISKFAIVKQNFAEIDDGSLFTPTLKKKRFIFIQKFEKTLKNAFSLDEVLSGRDKRLFNQVDVKANAIEAKLK